jgi:Right handed beta helix region
MGKSRTRQFLFALTTFVCTSFSTAHALNALNFVSYVSSGGSDSNDCSQTAPCLTFDQAIGKTIAGGQVSVLAAGTFGPALITKSLTIVNDTTGTATDCCSDDIQGSIQAMIVVAAGPNDVVTLRGLTINPSGNPLPGEIGVMIQNALQVNIEKCTIRNVVGAGIEVAPSSSGTLASSISLKIEDTIVTGTAAGARISSAPAVLVNVSISRSSFQNNSGGGIRLDTTPGAAITAAIADSTISLNAGNGLNALGSSSNVMVNLLRDVIASNGSAGVQANGATAAVLVNATALLNNPSALSAINGGRILTYGNNSIVGSSGSGFTGTATLQ